MRLHPVDDERERAEWCRPRRTGFFWKGHRAGAESLGATLRQGWTVEHLL